ncbi:hypothetical protein BaRGS_00002248 [Batillaria attramentaria]|uniref:Hexosyltransferase n=1 Tax=Batillaria attramentaria TaxID=370345 RepID=A0ABD0M5M9_9CAEN
MSVMCDSPLMTCHRHRKLLVYVLTAVSLSLVLLHMTFGIPEISLRTFKGSHFFTTEEFPLLGNSLRGIRSDNISPSVQRYLASNLKQLPPENFLDKYISRYVIREGIVNTFWPRRYWHRAEQLCGDDGPFLLAAVPSLASNVKERAVIRSTWGSPAYGKTWPRMGWRHLPSMKLVFVFGRCQTPGDKAILQAEADKFGDIVQTMAMLHWTARFCPSARHLLKVDEDTFVNVPLLLAIGFIHTDRPSDVHQDGKWAIGNGTYLPRHYPYYTVGNSYVISIASIRDLLEAFPHVPLIDMEDAYFTGILAKLCGVPLINCPLFACRLRNSTDCSLAGDWYVTETSCNMERKLAIWRRIKSGECTGKDGRDNGVLENKYIQRGEQLEW